MESNHSDKDAANLLLGVAQTGPKFRSVRRVFRILDLISEHGENLTAKQLAREVGTSLSSCYYLINILADEGYIEKLPQCGGYRIGQAVSQLYENTRSDFDTTIEPVLDELAKRSQRHAYSAVLSDGEMTVTQVKAPPRSPPVGVVEGFHGASHALALGKVLLASMGSEYVEAYIEGHGGLVAFTSRTIVQPAMLHAQLNKVRMVGLATDYEEFAPNLCCVASPVLGEGNKVMGAIGMSTSIKHIRKEGQYMVGMVQRAAEEASALTR